MNHRAARLLQQVLSIVILISLLASQFAIVYSAPVESESEQAALQTTIPDAQGALFRTKVTLRLPTDLANLEEMDTVILESGEDWALLLVTADQLEDLARLRFNPRESNELETLATAHAESQPWLAQSMEPMFADAEAIQEQRSLNTLTADTSEAELVDILAAMTVEQQAALTNLTSVDDDGDGLTNTQESWWCTDPLNPDSDGDGTDDGSEVQAAKDWLANTAPSYPATGKPFVGWPPSHPGCYDDDNDAIPDLAETWDLGLNPNLESTDRDKFDDGQELFGNTYCPGSGGFCGYGVYPRNEDWGVFGAQMPSWVERPGNGPLVAAFPVPEIDIVPASLNVEVVTTVTTDHVISSGAQESYSTSKTEGTSASVADTSTWNEWEEISGALSQQANLNLIRNNNYRDTFSSFQSDQVGNCSIWNTITGKCKTISEKEILGFDPTSCWGRNKNFEGTIEGDVGWNLGPKGTIGGGLTEGTSYQERDAVNINCKAYMGRRLMELNPQELEDLKQSVNFYNEINGEQGIQRTDPITTVVENQVYVNNAFDTSEIVGGLNGLSYAYSQAGNIIASQLYELTAVIQAPRYTRTETSGRSRGGSQTIEHSNYEEHTVTNGEAFSTEESWGTAVAVDSAHAADLWFTYKVSNIGTEYAREICDLTFNLYIGDDPNPATTYFVANDIGGNGCFNTFMPSEEHSYASSHIPLSLEQMKTVDLGGPIRIVVEDYTYGIDELFYEDASNAGVLVAIEDGSDDGDEAIDSYLIPTWGQETVMDVLTRYFPHETDADGNLTAIWTPEYRSDTPAWCDAPQVIGSGSQRVLWCKHALSVADWWNIYLNGLGDGTQSLQNTLASPSSIALFRFNKDSDLDGYSDRSEWRLLTDPNDASDYPQPELIAGIHTLQNGNHVTSTLSLLNTGLYDTYGVEAVMIAPDPTISITNNTVGGSGRVSALDQVVVGSRIMPPFHTSSTWGSSAQPLSAGYYTGVQDRIYSFTALQNGDVSTGTLPIQWDDGLGITGTLDIGNSYASPTPLPVGGSGVEVGFLSGDIQAGDTFTVAARLPRDTFQYQIQSPSYTPPVVLVSYNDPQGNHRFVTPISLTHPLDNLAGYSGQMLRNLGAEIVTQAPITTTGTYTTDVVLHWPASVTLQEAHLFLEFVNITGTVATVIPVTTTVQTGPNVIPITWDTTVFSPTFQTGEDYIVMVFWTDWQGNIIDTAARPLSSFQEDPKAAFATDETDLIWDFGTARQGTLMQRQFQLASVGFRDLQTYMGTAAGITLDGPVGPLLPADMGVYTMTINTEYLPTGLFTETIPIRTSDSANPTRNILIQGEILPFTQDDTQSATIRPLDVMVTITGTHNAGEWITYTHNLEPSPEMLHPLKVYSQDYTTLWGVGKYATDFSQGTVSADMFGDGSDGDLVVNSGETFYSDLQRSGITGLVSSDQNVLPVDTPAEFSAGDLILIHQTRGAGAGLWEIAEVADVSTSLVLASNLVNHYEDGGNNQAQVLRFPQYENCIINLGGTVTAHSWDGNTGGIVAFMCKGSADVAGHIEINGNNGAIIGVSGSDCVESGGKGVGGGFQGGNAFRSHGEGTGCSGWGEIFHDAQQGEGTTGVGSYTTLANGNGGGGGNTNLTYPHNSSGGGGGGNSAEGDPGIGSYGGEGGNSSGNSSLSLMTFGGGGGGGGINYSYSAGGGGAGAGIVALLVKDLNLTGAIKTDGGNGGTGDSGGGGGAGGSILIRANSATLGTDFISSTGGNGNGINYLGGDGSDGRIRVEYCDTVSGETNPTTIPVKLDCHIIEQIESTPFDQGRLNLPESFDNGHSYQIQYGRFYTFTTASEQIQSVLLPKKLYSSASLDALINNTGISSGQLALSLDIGNDGAFDWTYNDTANFPATIPVTDVVDALNAYLISRTDVDWDADIDVPVRMQIDQQADAFLTNLSLDLQFNQLGEFTPLNTVIDIGADRPLDFTVVVTGTHSQGEWVTYTHSLGPDTQTLHPVRVYNQPLNTLLGVGKYATDFSQGTTSFDMFGNGSDGDLTVSSTFFSDNIKAPISTSISAGDILINVPSTTGFSVGQEILIIQTRGIDAGKYEFGWIQSVIGTTIQLEQPLQNAYTVGGTSKAQILRIPHYRNVTIQNGGTLAASAWNGNSGGIIVFRVQDTLTVEGSISAQGLGFRGGVANRYQAYGLQGESYNGDQLYSRVNLFGGGGGGVRESNGGWNATGGGGGGHTNAGSDGVSGFHAGGSGPSQLGGMGGTSYGTGALSTLFLGSGGGAGGGHFQNDRAGGNGGNGGGSVYLAAKRLFVNGAIDVNGYTGQTVPHGGGGGGSGGAIYLMTSEANISIDRVEAMGGDGGLSLQYGTNGGNGSYGHISIEYCNTLTGTTNPAASTEQIECYIVEQVDSPPYNQGLLNLPEAVTDTKSYIVQYGRQYIFSGAGQQTEHLRMTRQVYGTASMEALVSNTGIPSGTRSLCLDIGDNGTCDYSQTDNVAFPATINIDTLTTALNDYLLSHNEVAWGDPIDVPVRVQVDGQADVILTNLALTPVGAKTRYLRLPAQTYAELYLDLLFSQPETNGALSFTVDVGIDGTVDWAYAGTQVFPSVVSSDNLAAAFNAYLAGRSGEVDVPIRIVPSPYIETALFDFSAVPSNHPDAALTATDISFAPGTPVESDTVTVSANLHNEGTQASDGLTTAFFATLPDGNEWYIGSTFVADVPAGGNTLASIPWNTSGFTGTVPVRVQVDPYNRLGEILETNNEATQNVTILTRPDLQGGFVLSDSEPVVSETITITLNLDNIGQTNAPSALHALYRDNPDNGGILIEDVTSSIISGGSSELVEFTWTPTEPGLHRLFIQVDTDDMVNEFNEGNNLLWQDVYVGFAGPLLLDSGSVATDPAYTPSLGYGVVDTGQIDVISSCGGTLPEETLRRDPGGEIVYQFDHLLPGHFYHLDITLRECDGAGRQEDIYIDGVKIAGTEDLSDDEIHRLSLRLDPALYADRTIKVTVSAEGIDGAVVAEVNLHDIDYRYADAGGGQDPVYPGEQAYGWLDGVTNISWGTLPYQSVRVEQSDNELRYRFDQLHGSKVYDINMTFWQPSGTARIQEIHIDGVPIDLTVNTGDYQLHQETIRVPVETYSDGTITVSIIRQNAGTGAMINEIALEENTLSDPVLGPHFSGCANNTGSNATVVVPTSASIIGNLTLEVGDEIAIFNANDSLCAGIGIWDGTNLAISAWGDDSQTGAIDGLLSGETMSIHIWDQSADVEYANVDVTYNPGNGIYSSNSFHVIASLDLNDIISQEIALGTGWNMISSYVIPEDPNLWTLFDGMTADMILMKNGQGQVFWPAYFINQIGNWNRVQGYQIYMLNNQTLTITGTPVIPENTPITLNAGWNLVSYLRSTPMPIDQALTTITGQFLLVKDNAGRVYWPAYFINQIGDMQPGQGYQIYMVNGAVLTYPANNAVLAAHTMYTPVAEPTHFTTCQTKTGNNATLVLAGENLGLDMIDGYELGSGDEIAVFDETGEMCVGVVKVTDTEDPVTLTVWGDNKQTEVRDGLLAGEGMEFRVWSQATDKEMDAATTFHVGDGLYQPDSWHIRFADVYQMFLPIVQQGESIMR